MQTLIGSSLALFVLGITLQAQTPDPADILRKADSACRLMRTATFKSQASGGMLDKPDWTRSGVVTMQRLDTTDDVGAMVHISLDDGTVYAYDGRTLNLLQPDKKTILVVGPDVPGNSFITGNVVGHLIPQAFVRDSLYAGILREAKEVTYRGTEQVGGVLCHVLRMRFEDDELVSDMVRELYIATSDYIPRLALVNYTFNGDRQQTRLELHDLRTNTEIPDGEFSLSVPDGYHYEEYVQPERPELLAEGASAPGWTLETPTGTRRSLADLRGKLVLLDFWYTTCGPCIMAMPTIQKLHERFGARGLAVYGINPWQEDSARAVQLMERKGFTMGCY